MGECAGVGVLALSPFLASLGLLGITAVWGVSFPLVNEAMRGFPPFLFVLLRFVLASAALFAVAIPLGKGGLSGAKPALVCGALLFVGFGLQTMGLAHTTAARAAFITGLSAVLVPVFEFLFFRVRFGLAVVLGVVLSFGGLVLLAASQNASFTPPGNVLLGDLLVLGCAVSFAFHILSLTHFGKKEGSLGLAAWQTLVVAVFAMPVHAVAEPFTMPTQHLWGVLVFLALVATSLVTVAQIVFQRWTSATHAALIFAMEPVFASGFAYFMQGETLAPLGFVGCVAMLAGVVVACVIPQNFRFQRRSMPPSLPSP